MSDEAYDRQEIWIPSKDRICDKLIESLKIALLQDIPSKEAAFIVWLDNNASALAYVGERQVSWMVRKVAEDLNLRYTTDQGYVKRNEAD